MDSLVWIPWSKYARCRARERVTLFYKCTFRSLFNFFLTLRFPARKPSPGTLMMALVENVFMLRQRRVDVFTCMKCREVNNSSLSEVLNKLSVIRVKNRTFFHQPLSWRSLKRVTVHKTENLDKNFCILKYEVDENNNNLYKTGVEIIHR